jgi:tRNA threonylcarbamoyladenosine biosynthesis protein TsaE
MPTSEHDALDFISHSVQQTQRLGARLGEMLEAGDVVLLDGDLGAGKTELAQGIARGVVVEEPVTSPTFTLVHEYRGRLPVYHVDLYRIGGEVEAADLGIEDYLYGDGVTLVEWSARAPGILPRDRLTVELRPVAETKRAIRMVPHGARYARLIAAFKRTVFGL